MKHQVKHLLTNNSSTDEELYSPTVSEISKAQNSHKLFSKYVKDKPFKRKDSKISPKVIGDIRVLMHGNKRLVIPNARIQSKVIQW